MNIGQVIRALRIERGLTQEALALEANVATSNISRVEAGRRQPTGSLLRSVAQALGTTVSWIYAQVESAELTETDGFSGIANQAPIQSSALTNKELSTTATAMVPDNEAALLLRYFRELSESNRQLVLAQVKLLRRMQRQQGSV